MKLKEGLDSMFVKNHMSWWRKPDHLQAVNENEVYFFSIKRGKLNDFRIPSELSKIWLHLAYDIETISPQTSIALFLIVHSKQFYVWRQMYSRMRRRPE